MSRREKKGMSESRETYGRGLYAGVLAFVSALSVAGNAVYAYAAPATVETSLAPGWAAAAHMIPPVLLLLVTEVLAMASTKFTGPGRAWALAGVVVIAVSAFSLSFDALYEVAQMAKVRGELAWLVPVMLDVAIVVCTILVLMASRQIQRDDAARGPVDEAGRHQVADSTAAHPVKVADTVADRHPTAVADLVADWPVAPVAVEPPVAGPAGGGIPAAVAAVVADEPVADASPQVEPVADDPPLVVAGPVADWSIAADPVADEPAEVAPPVVADEPAGGLVVADTSVGEVAEQVAEQVADEVVDEPVAGDPPVVADGDDLVDLAERVHAATGTTKPVEAVVRVLELSQEPDVSQRSISTEVGVDRTLVSKWIKAADELVDERPSLAVVR